MTDSIDCITSKNTCQMFKRILPKQWKQEAGCLVAAFDRRLMLQNPNRQGPWLPELTDALFLRLAEQSLNAKILPVMRATREISEICVVSQQNALVTLWLPLQSSNSSFPRPNWKASRAAAVSSSWSCWPRKNVSLGRNGRPWLTEGPGVCHHNAAGWSSPETWDRQKWKVDFFLAKYTCL